MADYRGPHQELINSTKALWGFDDLDLSFIRGNENWVYQTQDHIFRFTADYHRQPQELSAEVEWITYLADQGLSVSRPVASKKGAMVEPVSEDWTCVVFAKALGKQLTKPQQFTQDVFLSWGKLTGLLHKATQSFSPQSQPRNTWDTDDCYELCELAIKNTDPSHPLVDIYLNLMQELKSLEKPKNAFGLIHADFHHGNFFYDGDNKKITLFDFDDCHYFWHIFDLVVPFTSMDLSRDLRGFDFDYSDSRLLFMEAYFKEFNLDQKWLKLIPLFTQYRFVSLYFWAKGRSLKNRVGSEIETNKFMEVCEKLSLLSRQG